MRRDQSRALYGWRGLAGDVSGGTIAALIALPYGLAMAQPDGPAAVLRAVHVDPDRAGHRRCWGGTPC